MNNLLSESHSFNPKESSLVAVLLATFNGLNYLSEQVKSIYNQIGVNVTIFVSDDFSSDGTWEWLNENKNDKLVLLPRDQRFGSASANFFRLLRDVDVSSFDYVALSDQDDIWKSDKLIHSINKISEHKANAFSSNVIAFWLDGRKKLILKSQPQVKWDYIFQSAGPGCTYLFDKTLAKGLGDALRQNSLNLSSIEFHDWFFYAWARSNGYRWHIDSCPTLYYRQHHSNTFGANQGFKAYLRRLEKLLGEWYRSQILLTVEQLNERNLWFLSSLQRLNWWDRLILVVSVRNFRRSLGGQLILASAFIFMKK
jgi:rhamnosyltransferase